MAKKTKITAEMVREMLGLADRGRILDLFEKLMGGKIADALADLNELYDRGADPLAVMQDLLETTHFLTRVKVAPDAEGFFDGRVRKAAAPPRWRPSFRSPALTRAWQMLLKGLIEVRDATRPIAACEMALIRLSYAADLPPTDKLVRDLLDGGAPPAPRGVRARSVRPVAHRARCARGEGDRPARSARRSRHGSSRTRRRCARWKTSPRLQRRTAHRS